MRRRLPGVSHSSPPTMQPACADHPSARGVSHVSYSVTHTMLLDCQPFVHKHNGSRTPQSGPARKPSLRGFAVNINISLHRALGILMGGLCSLLRHWKKIAWCAALHMNAAPESCISFLKNNNYLWGSDIATLKNIIWFLLIELLLAVIQSGIIFPRVNSWCCNSLFITVICTWLRAGCEMHAVPQFP